MKKVRVDLRIPEDLHKRICAKVEIEGCSLNKFFISLAQDNVDITDEVEAFLRSSVKSLFFKINGKNGRSARISLNRRPPN